MRILVVSETCRYHSCLHRFDDDTDQDPIFHVDGDTDPDPDWHQNDADPHADPSSHVGQ